MENIDSSSIKEKLRRIIAKEVKIKPEDINDDSHILSDLGIDSADMISLLYEIEDEFGVEVSDEESRESTTIQMMANLLKEKINKNSN